MFRILNRTVSRRVVLCARTATPRLLHASTPAAVLRPSLPHLFQSPRPVPGTSALRTTPTAPARSIAVLIGGRRYYSGGGGGGGAGEAGSDPRNVKTALRKWLLAGSLSTIGVSAVLLQSDSASAQGADQHVLAHVAAGAGHALESDTVTADRVSSTYAYLMASLGITAASAWLSFTSGLSASICALNPWAVFGLMLLSGFTFVWGTLNTSIKSNPVIKHMLWAGLGASTGIWLGVVGYFSSAIVLKATLATACLLGGLSTVGYFSPTGTHRWMSGPLSVGLGLMCGASIAQFIWPSNSTLEHVVLYGGLALYGAFLVSDTNKMIEKARFDPLELQSTYDPINESVGIYLNTINLFLTILDILDRLENPDRRRRREERSFATLEEA